MCVVCSHRGAFLSANKPRSRCDSLPGLLVLPVSAGFKLRNGMERSGQRAGGVVRCFSGRARLHSGVECSGLNRTESGALPGGSLRD